jgi:starch phosphorylase
MENLYDLIENEVLPTYYDQPEKWQEMVLESMNDVHDFFGSDRMATEYYEKLY